MVIKNVYWAMLGKIVNVLSGLFVGILVARYLGPENFGVMNYVISYVTLFSILANFGLDNIEIRELSRKETDQNTILGTAFIVRLIFSVITILLILVTLLAFESDRFTFWMVLVYSSSLLLNTFNVIRNYFTSIVLNEYVVKTEITRTVVGAGIKIVLLIYQFSLAWFIIAITFDFLLIATGYIISYRRKAGSIKKWSFDRNLALYLIKESFPLLLSGTAVIIYQKVDQVMIRNMIDNAALGQFSVASRITELVIFIPMVIAQTVTPLLVKLHNGNTEIYKQKRQQFMDLMVWSALGFSVIMSLIAAPLIKILFGSNYLNAIPVLQIMSWKAVFMALFAASGQIIVVEHRQQYSAIRNLIGCFISVMLNLLLIPLWGIIGSALATVITYSFSGYFSHFFIKPYNYLIRIQSFSIIFGWNSIYKMLMRKS